MVSGGNTDDGTSSRQVWRLGLERLRWERLPDLTRARWGHACCVVRGGTLVSLGGSVYTAPGDDPDDEIHQILTASVEVQDTRAAGEAALSRELPQLSCGPFHVGSALVVDERESEAGQVLLIGGVVATGQPGELETSSNVWSVDLATGVCTPQPPLGRARDWFAAARLPGGRVVCVGDDVHGVSAEMWEPAQGTWRDLPDARVGRFGAAGCVLSDGGFAALGGLDGEWEPQSSCEALALDGTERWELLPPMHQVRFGFAAAAVGGCVIVAGGRGVAHQEPKLRSVEVYEEAAGAWRRLPRACDLTQGLYMMGSALI